MSYTTVVPEPARPVLSNITGETLEQLRTLSGNQTLLIQAIKEWEAYQSGESQYYTDVFKILKK